MKGPRLGAHMSISGGIDKSVERGRDAGCDAIQIFNKSNNQWKAKPLDPEEVERFKSLQVKLDIHPVVSHVSYLVNLASPDTDGLLQKSRESFLVEMQRCAVLDIPYFVMHPGSHVGSGVDEGLERIAQSLDWVFSHGDEFKTTVLLETTAGQGTNLGFRFEHLRRIIESAQHGDKLGICLDTCHVFAAGYDIGSRKGYEEMWREFDNIAGLNRLKVIHLNDSKKDLGSRVDRHEHIGKGAIGIEGFRLLVNDDRFAHVPMLLETPKGKDDAEDKENLAVLRSLVK